MARQEERKETPPSPENAPPPPECASRPVDRLHSFERVIDGQGDDCDRAIVLQNLEHRGPGAGPWHEDLFVATSPDGRSIDLSTAKKIRAQAAVPEGVVGPDGLIYLFFGEGDLERGKQIARSSSNWFRQHGLIGYGALGLMVSGDGLEFQEVPDFAIEGIVRGMVVDPEILRLPNGEFRLYYVGTPLPELLQSGAWDDNVKHRVFYAESKDLIHWRQIGEAVYGPYADPTVWCRGGGPCELFSTGLDRSRSTDGGKSFTFEGTHGIPGFAPELLPLGPRSARLFYNSKERGGPLRTLITEDAGQNWRIEGDVIGPYKVEAVSFVPRRGGDFLVYYHYWQEGFSGDSWYQAL